MKTIVLVFLILSLNIIAENVVGYGTLDDRWEKISDTKFKKHIKLDYTMIGKEVIISTPQKWSSFELDFIVREENVLSLKSGEINRFASLNVLKSGIIKTVDTEMDIILIEDNKYESIKDCIKIEKYKEFIKKHNKETSFYVFLFSGFLIVFIYNLIMYFSNNKRKELLYFAIFCFVVFLRFFSTFVNIENNTVFGMFSFEESELYFRIQHITFYLAAFWYLLYMKVACNIRLPRFLHVIFSCLFLSCIFLDSTIINEILFPASIFVCFVEMYFVFEIFFLGIKSSNTRLIFISFINISMFFAMLHDILKANHILFVNDSDWAFFTLYITIILSSFQIAVYFFVEQYKANKDLREASEKMHLQVKEHITLSKSIIYGLRDRIEASKTIIEDIIGNLRYRGKDVNSIAVSITLNDTKEKLNSLNNHMNKIESVSKDYLELTGIINMKLNLKEVELERLIKNVIYAEFEPYIQNISVSANIKDVKVKIDFEKMQKVVFQLIMNAVENCKDKLTLIIDINYEKDYFKITFFDKGNGMDPEELSEIMETNSFTTKEFENYSGIGMPFIKKVVSLHKGRIEIDSEKDNFTCIDIVISNNL